MFFFYCIFYQINVALRRIRDILENLTCFWIVVYIQYPQYYSLRFPSLVFWHSF